MSQPIKFPTHYKNTGVWPIGLVVICYAIQPLTYLLVITAMIGLQQQLQTEPDYHLRVTLLLLWGISFLTILKNVTLIADFMIEHYKDGKELP